MTRSVVLVLALHAVCAAGCGGGTLGGNRLVVAGADGKSQGPAHPESAEDFQLVATGLLGPFPDQGAACSALVASPRHTFPFSAPGCSLTPVDVSTEGLATAALVTVHDSAQKDPRLANANAYFVALNMSHAWFFTDLPLDQVNSGAGTTYLPLITSPLTYVPSRSSSRLRVLFVFRDNVEAVCSACEGAAREKPALKEARGVVVVCGRVGSGKPQCTAPLAVKAGSEVALDSDDVLRVVEPGVPLRRFNVRF